MHRLHKLAVLHIVTIDFLFLSSPVLYLFYGFGFHSERFDMKPHFYFFLGLWWLRTRDGYPLGVGSTPTKAWENAANKSL
jgi:uncharacterized membrane protein